jgi:hypothetical protein
MTDGELVVDARQDPGVEIQTDPPRDFKYPSLDDGMGVSVEALQYLAFAPKKHGDNYLVFDGFPFLDSKSELFQPWAQSSHDGVTMLVHRCARIDGPGNLFEDCDDKNAEFRGR